MLLLLLLLLLHTHKEHTIYSSISVLISRTHALRRRRKKRRSRGLLLAWTRGEFFTLLRSIQFQLRSVQFSSVCGAAGADGIFLYFLAILARRAVARSVCLEPQLTSVRQRAVKPALILSRSLRNFIPIPFCCDALRRFRLTLRQAQTYTHTHSGIWTHKHTGERTLQHTHTYLKSVPQWKLSFGSVLRYHFHFFLCRHSHTHMLTRSVIHTLTHSLTYT